MNEPDVSQLSNAISLILGRIELLRGPNCWLVYIPGDTRVLDAFGTNILPTPYTLHSHVEEVFDALRALNPHATIVMAGADAPLVNPDARSPEVPS